MFVLWLRQMPWCGDWTPASVPPPAEGRSSPTNTPLFLPLVPLCYWVLCVLCIHFHWSGPPAHLSWHSACTSVSEVVFLMYPWREMYSTYSSAIFVSAHYFIGLFISLILSYMSHLYISEMNRLSVALLAGILPCCEFGMCRLLCPDITSASHFPTCSLLKSQCFLCVLLLEGFLTFF